MDITTLSDNVRQYSAAEPSYGLMDEIHKLINHDFHMMQQQSSYGNHHHPLPYIQSYNSIQPRELINIIHEFLINPKALARLLVEDHNLQYMIEMAEKSTRNKDELQHRLKNRKTEQENTARYEEAVDIIDEFDEQGVETLDEEQLEIYEEYIEIIKVYESS